MTYKVMSFHSLMDKMRAVARGEKPAPNDAGKISFNSAEAAGITARGSSAFPGTPKNEKENPHL